MPPTTKSVSAATEGDRPVSVFGRILKELRGGRSVEQIVIALRTTRTIQVETSQGTVSGYEQGYNKKPDPVILWGLARVYGASLDGLIAVLNANRADPSLTPAAARRVFREHTHGPSPEVAAQALETARQILFEAAGDLEALKAGLSREPSDAGG